MPQPTQIAQEVVVRGAVFRFPAFVVSDGNGQPLDLVAANFTPQVILERDDGSPNLELAGTITTTNGSNDTAEVLIGATVTQTLAVGTYDYTLVLVNADPNLTEIPAVGSVKVIDPLSC